MDQSKFHKKYLDTFININVQDFISEVMKLFNVEKNHLKEVLKIYDNIKNSSSKLTQYNPKCLSSSLVYYYLKTKIDSGISIQNFSKIVELSELTLLKISNDLEKLD